MSQKTEDLGRLVLRITIGGLMLLHGIAKLKHPGTLPNLVAGSSLPGFVGYGVILGEVVAPVMLILGCFTRIAAPVYVLNMVIAVWLKHRLQIFQLGKSGGSAIELQLLYTLGAIAIWMLGPGRYSLSKGKGRWD